MFKGSMVALITPMLDDQADLNKLAELIEFHIESGTHGIVVAGTTGEAGTLSYEEKLNIIKKAVDVANERVAIIAGTAANATGTCIEITRKARELGADAALIMTPAYIKPTQEGLYEHYSHIAKATALPIILYNVPSRTACDLRPETIVKLARISNIVGVKEATGDRSRLQYILQNAQGNIDIFSGDDLTALEWMLAGAKGVISVTANVDPKRMAKLCDFALDSDTKQALALHEQLLPLHQLMFVESNPIPVKWAMMRMGLINNEIRMPLTVLSSEHHHPMDHVLKSLELI